MPHPPSLQDVRQIGPNSERQISGICSACRTILLARLDDKNPKSSTQTQLLEALEIVFERHMSRDHLNKINPEHCIEQGNTA